MSVLVPGYRAYSSIRDRGGSSMIRCVREEDNRKVLLKVPKAEYPEESLVRDLHNEFEMTRGLKVPGVLRALAWEPHLRMPALVMEDFDGTTVADAFSRGHTAWEEVLPLAIRVCEILEGVHGCGIVHAGLSPYGVLVSRDGADARLTDFHRAFRTADAGNGRRGQRLWEGESLYASPEQTGRVDLPMDRRSDFYSLGILFYELLVGTHPFQSEDHTQLVAFHLARRAVPPHERNPQLPRVVSDIVMKLISKSAEQRYLHAGALGADLRKCLKSWREARHLAPFQLGQGDGWDRLAPPQKLHGRKQELGRLEAAFERAEKGRNGLVLISGPAGVGKSTLAQELRERVAVPQRGYFISGKAEQANRDLPYGPVAQAFGSLVRQLLTEGNAELAEWKGEVKISLGGSGRVLVDLVPELEWLVGDLPRAAEPHPSEASRRLHYLFLTFLSVFRRRGRPVVMLLDDMHWSDAATLELVKAIFCAPEHGGVLVVWTYRENRAGLTAPFHAAIRELARKEVPITRIPLQGLPLTPLNELVADVLRWRPEATLEIAEAVHGKTGGNPFASLEFLRILHAKGLLRGPGHGYDTPAEGGPRSLPWSWDLAGIRGLGATDGVAELMVERLKTLDFPALDLLKVSACLGNRFRTASLAAVSDRDEEAVAEGMDELEAEGWVSADSPGGYAFQHDRIQQAAYSLLSEKDKAARHLRIARSMLEAGEAGAEDDVFEIAKHANRCRNMVASKAEQRRFAEVNAQAARKAAAAAAHAEALAYYASALEYLSDAGAREDAVLAYSLHLGRGECEYLTLDFEAATRSLEKALALAGTGLEKAMAHAAQMRMHEHLLKHGDSVKSAIQGLQLLGRGLPASPGSALLAWELFKTACLLAVRRIPGREHRPSRWTPESLAAMRLLADLWSTAFLTGDMKLQGLVVFRMLGKSLRYGDADISAVAYVCYGVFLFSVLRLAKKGRAYCEAALALTERFPNPRVRGRVLFLYSSFLGSYRQPHGQTLAGIREAFRTCMEAGDLLWAGYCRDAALYIMAFSGFSLEEIDQEAGKLAAFARSTGNRGNRETALTAQRWIGLLQGSARNCLSRMDAGLAFGKTLTDPMEKGFHAMLELQLFVLFRRWREALEVADSLRGCPIIDPAGGFWPIYCFHRGLALAGLCAAPSASVRERGSFGKEMNRHLGRLQAWSRGCPESFGHMYALLAAEISRLAGDRERTLEAYEKALAAARANGHMLFTAMANEMAGRFCLEAGLSDQSSSHLREAYHGYLRWGALAKAQELDSAFLHLSLAPSTYRGAEGTGEDGAAQGGMEDRRPLDFKAVVKASQAISGEIVLSKLPKRLLRITLENAGAQKGFLILEQRGNLMVVAFEHIDSAEAGAPGAEAPGTETPLPMPLEACQDICQAAVHYAARTRKRLVIPDAAREGLLQGDPYVVARRPKSILCMPLLSNRHLVGLLYLENNLFPAAFTPERLEMLELLNGQTVVSLSNARFHAMQMDHLQAKIQPHFLFNTLSSIAQLTRTDPLKAEQAIVQLSHLYRYILTAFEGKMVRLNQELEITRAYLFIEKMRFPEKLEYEITSSGDAGAVSIPGLIIQPLVENSIRHGLTPKVGDGKVSVHAEVLESLCRITVSDNGVGWGKSPAGTGHGIKSLHDRLHLAFGDEYSIGITRQGGVTVEVTIPILR